MHGAPINALVVERQTQRFQKPSSQDMGVRVSPSAPIVLVAERQTRRLQIPLPLRRAGSSPAGDTNSRAWRNGSRGRPNPGFMQVRILPPAPIRAPFAKRQRHLVYTQTFGGSSPSGSTVPLAQRESVALTGRRPLVRSQRGTPPLAGSSMVEPTLDKHLTWVRFPTGQPMSDAKPQTRMERERTFNPSACGS